MYHPFSIAETIKAAWDVIKKNYISLIVYSIISLICYEVISFFTSFIFVYDNAYSQITFVLFMMLVQSYLVLSFYKLILTLIDREYYEFEFRDILPSLKMALSFVTVGILYTFLIGTIIFINLLFSKSPSIGTLLDNIGLAGVLDTIRVSNFLDNLQISDILDKVEIVAIAYLLIRSIFCLCFIVDDDSGPIESLRQSFAITRNNFFKIIGLILIVVLFIALLLVIINLIITLLFDVEDNGYIIKIAGICWFAVSFPTVQVMIMATYRKLVYSMKDIDDDISEAL